MGLTPKASVSATQTFWTVHFNPPLLRLEVTEGLPLSNRLMSVGLGLGMLMAAEEYQG